MLDSLSPAASIRALGALNIEHNRRKVYRKFVGALQMRMFQKLGLLILICCLVAQPVFANERVALGDGRVSFIPPAGFKQLVKEEIAKKYFRGNPPQYAFANETLSTSVAITFSSTNLSPEQLPEYKDAMETMLPRLIPGLQWLKREFVEMTGRKWLHLEMTSHAIDTDIHNHIYSTSFNGKALIFGFNSTVKEYPKMKEALEKSVQTIKLNE